MFSFDGESIHPPEILFNQQKDPDDKNLITGIFLLIEEFPRRMYAFLIKKETNTKGF